MNRMERHAVKAILIALSMAFVMLGLISQSNTPRLPISNDETVPQYSGSASREQQRVASLYLRDIADRFAVMVDNDKKSSSIAKSVAFTRGETIVTSEEDETMMVTSLSTTSRFSSLAPTARSTPAQSKHDRFEHNTATVVADVPLLQRGHIAFVSMDGSGKWLSNAARRMRVIACHLRKTPGVSVSLYLQIPDDSNNSLYTKINEWKRKENFCNESKGNAFDPFEILLDPPFSYKGASGRKLNKRQTDDDRKIRRLAVFRDYLRNELRKKIKSNASPRPSAIVLVDGDLMSFPHADAVSWNIAKIQANQWQALCANGRAGHHWHERYYDTFATVLPNGSYPYHDIYVHHQNFVQTTASNDNLYQSTWAFIDKQTQGCTRTSHGSFCSNLSNIVPQRMQSCFGGMTVYATDPYLDSRCSYQNAGLAQNYNPVKWHSTIASPCEHVVLHLCLNQLQDLDFNIAVAPDMMTFWGGS